MTSGQDVSEYLDTLGLVKSYFSLNRILLNHIFFRVWVTVRLYSPWKTTMTSSQDVSEFLDTLGLVKSYFFQVFWKKKIEKKIDFFLWCSTPQRIRRFACLQDCLLTLTCHLAKGPERSLS